jgi:class 3 adenylate cyclase
MSVVAGTRAELNRRPLGGRRLGAAAWVTVGALPLVGLVSLLSHDHLDPGWTNPRVHFVLFTSVGALAAALALVAQDGARRRGDARVLLVSLAFLATGGFMAVHALGTVGVLFDREYAGFKVAIPVGLVIASGFAVAAAFVDLRPDWAPTVIRRRRRLQEAVLAGIAVWIAWTLLALPPLSEPLSEGTSGSFLSGMAAVGTVAYGAAAIRFWRVFRDRMTLLPASLIACFVLLVQAMFGVATTGERAWHASWWLWHALIVVAYCLVAFAARRQWRDERFRPLYLETTRQRTREVSVLFSDLAGYTAFTERSRPDEVAAMLDEVHGTAMPLASRRFGGVVEALTGDGMYVSFNAHSDQPDHAARAAGAALALQEAIDRRAAEHPGWPRLRVGVNTGEAVIQEMGGDGFVAYQIVGDVVNIASRLEGQAPVGGVLVGAETYRRLPDGTAVESRPGLRVKGKDTAIDAYLLRALP